jgi:hypothetical protein
MGQKRYMIASENGIASKATVLAYRLHATAIMTDYIMVHLLRAGTTLEGTTTEVCQKLGEHIGKNCNWQERFWLLANFTA